MITKLTKEQEAAIPSYVKKWTLNGLKTTRISPADATKAATWIYKTFLPENALPQVVMSESPTAANKLAQELTGTKGVVAFTAQSWYWAGYYGFYDYVLEELFPEKRDEFKLFSEFRTYLQTINWIIPLSETCIVVQNPVEIHLGPPNAAGIRPLHKDGAMAVKYADGTGIYMLNGTSVTEEIACTPAEKLSVKLVLSEQNAQVRAEIVRKIGMARICRELGAKVLDEGGGYQLITLEMGDGRVRPYLRMRNPSVDMEHVEGVHPDCLTVRAALEWRNGSPIKPSILT